MGSTQSDARRVEAIQAYDVLQVAREQLTGILELSARIAGVPTATINIITDREQVQLATVGFEGSTSRREDSMCARVVEAEEPVLLSDASTDPRVRGNPFFSGELGTVRFYAAQPLVTPEGVTVGTLCVFDDEVHAVDDELRDDLRTLADAVVGVFVLERATRDLAAADGRLGAFASQVSHDLKNPLASVMMAVELAADTADDPSQVELLERAQRGARRMETLIEEILDHARSGIARTHHPVDLAALLVEVREGLGTSADRVTSGELPVLHSDPVLVRRILQTLVGNAVKSSSPDRPAQVEVHAVRGRDLWRIEVRVGTQIEGDGIGLDTCRRLVSSLGGSVGVRSEPGQGSTFWFTLPVV